MHKMMKKIFKTAYCPVSGRLRVIGTEDRVGFRIFPEVSLHSGQGVWMHHRIRIQEDQDLSRSRRSPVIAGPSRAMGAAGQGDYLGPEKSRQGG
jgi:hypothetical protein